MVWVTLETNHLHTTTLILTQRKDYETFGTMEFGKLVNCCLDRFFIVEVAFYRIVCRWESFELRRCGTGYDSLARFRSKGWATAWTTRKMNLLFAVFIIPIFAFHWPWKQQTAQRDMNVRNFLLQSAQELLSTSSSFETEIIEKALQRLAMPNQVENGCLTKILLQLKGQCMKLEMDETLKTRFAIACTECELPREAGLFPRSCSMALQNTLVQGDRTQECLQDLTMSIPAWTSYVNAFTRVTITCLDAKFPLERQFLSQLQANLSLLQISLVEQFQKQHSHWMELRGMQADGLKLQKQHFQASFENLGQTEKMRGELSVLMMLLEKMQRKMKRAEDEWQQVVELYETNLAQTAVALEQLATSRVQNFEMMLEKLDRHVNQVMSRMNTRLDSFLKQTQGWEHSAHWINGNISEALLLQKEFLNVANATRTRQESIIQRYELQINDSTAQLVNLSYRIAQVFQVFDISWNIPVGLPFLYIFVAKYLGRPVWYAFAAFSFMYPLYSAYTLLIFPLLAALKLVDYGVAN